MKTASAGQIEATGLGREPTFCGLAGAGDTRRRSSFAKRDDCWNMTRGAALSIPVESDHLVGSVGTNVYVASRPRALRRYASTVSWCWLALR